MNHEPSNQLAIYCDGGSRGNPGPGASAFIVKNQSGQVIHQQGFYLGSSTNNQAEYQAVIEALKWLLKHHELSNKITATFYLDSLLVVSQINGTYKIKDQKLKLKNIEIKNLIETYGLGFVVLKHVPRSLNSAADRIVNEVLDKVFF